MLKLVFKNWFEIFLRRFLKPNFKYGLKYFIRGLPPYLACSPFWLIFFDCLHLWFYFKDIQLKFGTNIVTSAGNPLVTRFVVNGSKLRKTQGFELTYLKM